MVKSVIRWYFNRKAVQMHKASVGMQDPLRRKKVKMRGTKLYRGGDGVYNYGKPVQKAYLKYLMIAVVVISCAAWLGYQSYLGWDLFQP